MQPKVAKESGRSSSHKASKNLDEMDIERVEATKRLEFTPTEDKVTKKQKQESADEDERREKTVHCQDRQASDEESERSKDDNKTPLKQPEERHRTRSQSRASDYSYDEEEDEQHKQLRQSCRSRT